MCLSVTDAMLKKTLRHCKNTVDDLCKSSGQIQCGINVSNSSQFIIMAT